MELRHYIDILKRRAMPIIICAALAMTVVAMAGLLIAPVYTASATVRVLQDIGVRELRLTDTYTKQLMNTYVTILKSWPILEEAGNRLGNSLPASLLYEKVQVEVIPNTELIRIAVEDEDPAFARDLANTLAELLVEYAQSVYTGNDKSNVQILAERLDSLEENLRQDRQQLAALVAEGKLGTEIDELQSQIESNEGTYDYLLDQYELARLNESLRANSVTVVSPARLPRLPSNSLGLKQIGLSIIVGLGAGVGMAALLENMDTRIHSPHQLEVLTRMPVLGTVPQGSLPLRGAAHSNGVNGSQPIGEAYRLLGINLQSFREDMPLQTILITSAAAQEGKSTVAANLAHTLAERGQTVFLVDSDLRHPSLVTKFGIENNGVGLSNLLTARGPLDGALLGQALHPAEQPSLFVIGSGFKRTNPTSLLASPPMAEFLGYLGSQGQTTLLDAPPVLGLADVSVLAPKVDGVILVVRQSQSKREELLGALKQLQASRARILGFIFIQKSDRDWGYEHEAEDAHPAPSLLKNGVSSVLGEGTKAVRRLLE
jgi:capsular exopolysaccharide synthesis family protein